MTALVPGGYGLGVSGLSPDSGGIEVRRLTAPTRTEIEQLAEIFDLYRTHYGEAADAPQVARWLEENISSGRVEAFVAEEGYCSLTLPLTPDSQRS